MHIYMPPGSMRITVFVLLPVCDERLMKHLKPSQQFDVNRDIKYPSVLSSTTKPENYIGCVKLMNNR